MSETELPETLEEALEIIRRQRAQLVEQEEYIKSAQLPDNSWEQPSAALRAWRKLRRLFRFRLGLNTTAQIQESGLFDENYYREQVQNRDDVPKAGKNLLKHYLSIGGFEGLDPSDQFDSDWYLANYPDVQAVGINPLLHYVQFGREENRLPYAGAPLWTSGEPKRITDFNTRLWGGFSHVALPVLKARADETAHPQASWCVAAWYYAHGRVDLAVERVKQLVFDANKKVKKRPLVGLAKCYTQLENYEGLASLINDHAYVLGLGNTYPYVRATLLNGQGRPDESLAAINDVFFRAGLVGIERLDSDRPLGLDNLRGSVNLSPNETASDAMPLLSVVVPAYNAESTLHIALDGLLAQSWRNLEIIIVDDGSTDNTAQVAEAYVKKDARVRYVPNPINMGAYPTRNNGMRAARGEFVTVHDSDDWSHPQKLERQIQPLINDPSKAATVSSWVRVAPDLRFVGPWLLSDRYVEKNHSSLVFRRGLLDKIGYWDEVNVAGDTEFLWRLENHVDHYGIVHVLPATPLSFALADDSSLTRTKASHVKTIHHGLRRIYRESARWWHQQVARPVLESQKRPFPVPLGIVREVSLEFDAVLTADMSVEGEELEVLLQRLDAGLSEYERVCLLHWPSYNLRHGAPIADGVFDFCQKHNTYFAHHGISITAPKVRILDRSHEMERPTQTVRLPNVERVEWFDGSLCQPQAELVKYFLNGEVSP